MDARCEGRWLDLKSRRHRWVTARRSMHRIHFKEVHRKEMVDFGRELDGSEPVHCLEAWPGTDTTPTPIRSTASFPLQKRRYSCFVGTDLDILLRA